MYILRYDIKTSGTCKTSSSLITTSPMLNRRFWYSTSLTTKLLSPQKHTEQSYSSLTPSKNTVLLQKIIHTNIRFSR